MAAEIPAARRLARALEPIAGQAQFSPECHAHYVALGFDPSPGLRGRTALPDLTAFWTARTAVMGDTPPQVVAAALAVFNPDLVVPALQRGRAVAADRLREYRGDSHIQVWSAAGFDPVEIGLLSDLYWGLPPRAHTSGRGWTADQLAAGEDRLRARGLLEGDTISAAGRAAREDVEARTDAALAPALAVLDGALDDLVTTLRPWGTSILDAGGYLTPLVRFTF